MTKDVQQQKIYSGTRLLRTLEGNEKEYVLNKVRSIQKCDFPRRHHGQSRNICVYTQGVTRFIQLLGAFLALFRLLVLFVEKIFDLGLPRDILRTQKIVLEIDRGQLRRRTRPAHKNVFLSSRLQGDTRRQSGRQPRTLRPSSSFPLHSHHTSSQSICQQQWRNV